MGIKTRLGHMVAPALLFEALEPVETRVVLGELAVPFDADAVCNTEVMMVTGPTEKAEASARPSDCRAPIVGIVAEVLNMYAGVV